VLPFLDLPVEVVPAAVGESLAVFTRVCCRRLVPISATIMPCREGKVRRVEVEGLGLELRPVVLLLLDVLGEEVECRLVLAGGSISTGLGCERVTFVKTGSSSSSSPPSTFSLSLPLSFLSAEEVRLLSAARSAPLPLPLNADVADRAVAAVAAAAAVPVALAPSPRLEGRTAEVPTLLF
jgi:hypothetical protein